ncbi:MAG: hypothetical protein Q7J27_12830 [Syntrophales bacterium]|nr:hypothetical protein [Syntrophales bacterium]
MNKIISFKKHGESCANCVYYVPRRDSGYTHMIDGPPSEYCTHPDRTKGDYLIDSIISELGLHREPHQWCSKYKKRIVENPPE